MALTNENLIAEIRGKYAISEDFAPLTVYRSSSATSEQCTREYILGEDDVSVPVWGSHFGTYEEVVVAGEHTLSDADGVWEEYVGELQVTEENNGE
jgi:hypothetical protein